MLTNERNQLGTTMISLLIGLLVSVLCILASLSLYRNMVDITADATIDANYDGMIATAMLTAQLEVQNAGFGIDAADATDVVVDDADNALLWRSTNDGVVYQCRGLQETERIEGDRRFRALRVVTSAVCNDLVDLTTLVLDPGPIIAEWFVLPRLANYIAGAGNGTLFNFVVQAQECSPFGVLQPERHLTAMISAPTSSMLNGAGNQMTTYTLCLANTYPP